MNPIKSRYLTRSDAALVKALLDAGFHNHDVATIMHCNQGRISEIATGRRYSDVEMADLASIEARQKIGRNIITVTVRLWHQLDAALTERMVCEDL